MNNLEIALSSIATKTKEAVDTAKEAKTVTAAVDDSGVLSLNGHPQDITLVMPSTVQTAVADALGAGETASRIAEEQAKFTVEQQNANMRIAIEKGVFYLEDALPADLRNKVLTGWFAKNKQTPEQGAAVSRHLQEYINNLPAGAYVTARKGSVFSLDKNVGVLPELFGADGRRVTVDGMTLTIDGAQPCVYIAPKDFRFYDFAGVQFIVESFGVNCFEFGGGRGNRIIHGGEIRTRAFLEIGYVGGRQGLFAPIDGWTEDNPHIAFGYADKGVHDLGFNTTTLHHDLARYRNNAAQVQDVMKPEGLTWAQLKKYEKDQSSRKQDGVGGYWNADGTENMFPQDDGTTSPRWGKWRGGQRGSAANGIVLYNTHDTIIDYFDVQGFTGSAVQLGLYGTQDCQDVSGGDMQKAIDKGMVCYNTMILGGFAHANYIGGVGCVRVVGVLVTGLDCRSGKVGHPDASVTHSRDFNMVTVDPGYWLWTSRYMPMKGIRFLYNSLGFAARKIIDAHTGDDIKIIGNSGSCLYYGVSIVVEEKFASRTDRKPDPSSFYYQESNFTIKDNTLVSAMYGIHLNNGALGVSTRKAQDLWWLRANIQVRDNRTYSPVGLIYNYGHNRFDITGNSATFALPFGEPFGLRHLSKVEIKNGGSGYSAGTTITVTGGGEGARGAAVEPVIKNGVITYVKITAQGTMYADASLVSLEIRDPAGTGSGAVLTPVVGVSANAFMFGAEGKYGTITGSNFSYNTARNSPDGNYSRMLVTANCNACTFTGNRFDFTPYTKGENSAKPYISEKAEVFRNGMISQVLAQTANHTDSTHEDNKGFNQLTGQVMDLVFKNDQTKMGSNPANVKLTKPEVDKLIEAAVAAAIAKLPQAQNGQSGQAEQGQTTPSENPATPAQPTETPAQPAPVQTRELIVFNFENATDSSIVSVDGRYQIAYTGVDKLKDKSSLVHASEAPRYIETRFVQAGQTTGAYPKITGIKTSDSAVSTVLIPLKVTEQSSRAVSFLFAGENAEGAIVGGTAATAAKVDEGAAFTMGTVKNLWVNGNPADKTTKFPVGQWLILAFKWQGTVENLALLARNDGNPVLAGQIGAGLTVYPDRDLSAEELAAEVGKLKTVYGIA